jgi:putative oxidoreductase
MKTILKLKSFMTKTLNEKQSIIPRIIVGLIFFSEGIQKYLFPELNGTGRFEKIGFSDPAFWAYFTATFKIICGFLIFVGLLTRLASMPLLIVMATAFVTTKWPMLVDKGFWSFAHEYRTDFAMTLLLVYMLIYGAGNYSLDSKINKSSTA